MLSIACPLLSASAARTLDPSLNVTVPVGVGPPEEATVAVKTTDWPNVDGLSDEVSVVVAVVAATVMVAI